MEFQVWLAFFAASWVIAVSPGSGAVLSMSHGLAYGVRGASATIAGLELGLSLILLVAGLGVGALLLASATAFAIVKVLGAGYLMWLGWKQWRSAVSLARPSEPQATECAIAEGRCQVPSVRSRVLTGFMTNVTNPKGIVFMVAVLPQFIDSGRTMWLQLLVLLATSVGVDVLVMHGYAFLASRAQHWLATARAQRAQNRVFGGVLMAMGASLLMVKRAGG